MLELHDIQGSILRRNLMPCGTYLFLRIDDAADGRRWLRELVDPVTSATEWWEATRTTLNVAFTHAGLAALGVPISDLEGFPAEFRADIAARREKLGDTGESSPDRWDRPLGTPDVHALVILHARDEATLATESAWHGALLERTPGVVPVYEQPVAQLPTGTEHFGYRDGIGEPAIEGSANPVAPGQGPLLKAGEFVLGYPDEGGELAPLPRLDLLGRNGSYLVVRKLHQKVAEFRAFLARESVKLDGSGQPDAVERLAAKLVGRWRSGAPLVLAPDRDDPELARDHPERLNDFRYRDEDPKGFRCPKGAHIRRVYPRDALNLEGGLVNVQRHRMIRRGLPYGPWLPESAPDDGVDRGIVFLFIGASIARQFEFVQEVWINDGTFAGLGPDKDAVLGANDGAGTMTIPVKGKIYPKIRGIARFVTVKGGGYFFLPSIRALGHLATAGAGAAERTPRPPSIPPERAITAASITDPGGPP